ncbi:MAG TPA: hypothetical protein VMH32_18785 [Burkholderiales bacterium]|nr:hypothetical protein [Burkholderiales bacterium]
MIEIQIPGFGHLELEQLVCDYNGTLALDGALIEGVAPRIVELSRCLNVHVLTADTYGTAEHWLASLPCGLTVIGARDQDQEKAAFAARLGRTRVAAIGNGRNDRALLAGSALAIAVLGNEGTAVEAIGGAHVIAPSILVALDLLLNPRRLVASLRV